ncbi:MAG: Uncharacterised protein [Synechococcus sp. MIT S9220]|nr:MAG: Uncharacterised protein [Synechococcus sp. MIT S9220]
MADTAAELLFRGRRRNGEFLQEHVEAVDGESAGLWALPKQLCAGSSHLLKGHIGGGQRTVLEKDVAQSARIHRKDAWVSGHQCIAHIAKKPAQVTHRFAHECRAVLGHADGGETRGQNDADIGIAAADIEEPGEEIAALGDAAVTREGAHGLFEGGLVSRQRGGIDGLCPGHFACAEWRLEERKWSSSDKNPVGRAGDDRFSVAGDDL